MKILLISTTKALIDHVSDDLHQSGITIEAAAARTADKTVLREAHAVIVLDLDSPKDIKLGWIAK